jgi:CRISPR/Cas system CSM-associated protein Csm3 (group 7 of RAMP superfamily)
MRIKVRLRNLSLLVIGSAYSRTGIADICVVRAGDKIFIPGSSLKGVLRTAAHRISRKMGFTSCGEVEPSRIAEAHRAAGGKCDVCNLFGMPGPPSVASSKVIVGDMKPVGSVSTFIIGRTSIEPSKGKAREGSLRTVEVIPTCTIFEGEIDLLSSDRRDLILLLGALDEMRYMSFGRGGLVDLMAEVEGADVSGLDIAKSLSSWRWNICP